MTFFMADEFKNAVLDLAKFLYATDRAAPVLDHSVTWDQIGHATQQVYLDRATKAFNECVSLGRHHPRATRV
jgi:hypothetical protein